MNYYHIVMLLQNWKQLKLRKTRQKPLKIDSGDGWFDMSARIHWQLVGYKLLNDDL